MPRSWAKQIGTKFRYTVVTPAGVTLTIVPFGGVKGTVPDIEITEPRVWHIVFHRDLGLYEYARQPAFVADLSGHDVLVEAITAAVVAELSGSATRMAPP